MGGYEVANRILSIDHFAKNNLLFWKQSNNSTVTIVAADKSLGWYIRYLIFCSRNPISKHKFNIYCSANTKPYPGKNI